MKIILGKQIEEVKKKDSENEKNLLKNRNSDELNEVDIDFRSNTIKNIKLGTQLVNRIYLNNNIIYDLEKDTILLDNFHSLVPLTATSIIFDKLVYQDITNYNLVGYCDANNHIAVYQNNTEYLVLNVRNAVIYAPGNCSFFFLEYQVLTHCVFCYFNTMYVTSMAYMFYNCRSLISLDLSSFDTANVMDMDFIFRDCYSLITIISNSFVLKEVLWSSNMFTSCTALVGGNGTTYNSSHTNAEYARVDGENGLPGYFTAPPATNNK